MTQRPVENTRVHFWTFLPVLVKFYFLNQFGHKRCRHRLEMGGQTSPSIFIYFSEFVSPSHIKLTDNNPDKGFESVERP